MSNLIQMPSKKQPEAKRKISFNSKLTTEQLVAGMIAFAALPPTHPDRIEFEEIKAARIARRATENTTEFR